MTRRQNLAVAVASLTVAVGGVITIAAPALADGMAQIPMMGGHGDGAEMHSEMHEECERMMDGHE